MYGYIFCLPTPSFSKLLDLVGGGGGVEGLACESAFIYVNDLEMARGMFLNVCGREVGVER